MKKSDIEFIKPDTKGAPLDRYYARDFTQTIESFLSKNLGDAISVSSKLDDLFYINICSTPAANFFHRALNLLRCGMLRFHMQDIDDMFYILIKAEEELRMTAEERAELIELARSAGFYISINADSGAIIAKCEIERTTSIIVQAITLPCPFLDYLEIAFEKKD